MVCCGVDQVEISRIDQIILRHGRRFFERCFTQQEVIDARGHTAALAARFAAKEAVAKALGTGIGVVRWREIEVVSDSNRRPILRLHGKAAIIAEELDLIEWSVSLSHTRDYAIAIVVGLGSRITST